MTLSAPVPVGGYIRILDRQDFSNKLSDRRYKTYTSSGSNRASGGGGDGIPDDRIADCLAERR